MYQPTSKTLILALLLLMPRVLESEGAKALRTAEPIDGSSIYLPLVTNPSPNGMILIPSGEFQMGCDESNPSEECLYIELPLHTVYLDTYYIDRYEVTNGDYAEFLNRHGSNLCGGYECYDIYQGERHISLQDGQYVVEIGYEDHPANLVTWYGADSFCRENNKRLPTEAEWEKAARGSNDTRKYPWGSEAPNCSYANANNCVGDTTPVGSYPAGASPYGVMDMLGNMGEWVNDRYAGDYYSVSPYANPPGPITGGDRVMRGGNAALPWLYVRVAVRYAHDPADWENTSGYLGFRCADSVD